MHQLKHPIKITSPLDIIEIYDNNLTDSLNEPVPLVSTIPPQGDFFKKNYIRNLNMLNDKELYVYNSNVKYLYLNNI